MLYFTCIFYKCRCDDCDLKLLQVFLVTFQSVCTLQNKRNISECSLQFMWHHFNGRCTVTGLLGWNTSLCFYGYSKSLFCPCLLVKCPAVFHSWLSDVLKGRGGTACRAALHQGLLTAVWREGSISDTKGKHTYLVWDKGCPGQLSKGLNSPFVCTQLEDH